MSVIPDIILHKVCQVYMCYTIRSLFLSCRHKKALKKSVHQKFLPVLRLRP